MEWHIITCDNSRHIIPAQKHLFSKYVPDADVRYIDVKDMNIDTWTCNIMDGLSDADDYLIFGLDDFLPIDHMPEIHIPLVSFDRIELGWGGSRKGSPDLMAHHTVFADDELYRVSCQFSIWNKNILMDLLSVPRSPWNFEKKGRLSGNVLGLKNPWIYIEESAVSSRRPGKVNLCGLRMEDIEELFDLNLVNPEDVIYGWKGDNNRTKDAYGIKYKNYY